MTEPPPVLLDVADGVATVTLNRPTALNALNRAAKRALLDALDAAQAARVLVIRGTGRAFCSGQDLREHAELLRAGDPDEVASTVREHYNRIALAIADFPAPVIAAVNGVAAGAGASIAFLADVRLVSASAGFHLSFVQAGLAADTGCTWTLPRLIGPTRAMELLMLPRMISAEESARMGIATEVIADERFDARVAELAGLLATGPTVAYRGIRHCVNVGAGASLADTLEAEADAMAEAGRTADHADAVDAFLAKRPQRFTGR